MFFSVDAGASAALYVLRKLAHGFLCDRSTFATRKRYFGLFDGDNDLRAGALALFPQGKSFLDRVFLAQEATTLNRLANERLLVGSQVYFQAVRVRA